MARAPAKEKSKKPKSVGLPHHAKRTVARTSPKKTHKNAVAKAKPPSSRSRKPEKKNVSKSIPGRNRPARKQGGKIVAGSGKLPAKAVSPPPAPAPARLLHQTKTTSAALTLLGKGVELIYQKDFKKAKVELKSLLQLYPAELDILARARSYIQICEREEANLKKPAVSADQLYALGILEHNKGNYDAAIANFLQSLTKHPGADYIYYSIAASQAKKGDLAKALENLRKAVELNEDSRIYAKNDADFSALQSEREFAELVGLHPTLPAE